MIEPLQQHVLLASVRERVASAQTVLDQLDIRIELLEPEPAGAGDTADEVVVNFWRSSELLDVIEFSLSDARGGASPSELMMWFDGAMQDAVRRLCHTE